MRGVYLSWTPEINKKTEEILQAREGRIQYERLATRTQYEWPSVIRLQSSSDQYRDSYVEEGSLSSWLSPQHVWSQGTCSKP